MIKKFLITVAPFTSTFGLLVPIIVDGPTGISIGIMCASASLLSLHMRLNDLESRPHIQIVKDR